MSLDIPFTFLAVLFVISEFRNYKERVGLINRILAKDLTDLSSYETEVKRVKIPDKIKNPGFEI